MNESTANGRGVSRLGSRKRAVHTTRRMCVVKGICQYHDLIGVHFLSSSGSTLLQ